MGVPGTPISTHRPGSDRGPLLLLHDVQDDLRVRALDVLHRDEVLDERVELLRVLEARDDHAVVLPRDVVHVDDLVLPPDLPLDLEELPLRDPDTDHREDVVAELLLVEDRDVPDDDPLLLEALHAVADRADADLQLPRDVPEALPRIRVQPPEDRDVEFVEELHGHGGPRRARRYLSLSRADPGSVRVLPLRQEPEPPDPLVDRWVGREEAPEPARSERVHDPQARGRRGPEVHRVLAVPVLELLERVREGVRGAEGPRPDVVRLVLPAPGDRELDQEDGDRDEDDPEDPEPGEEPVRV